MSFGLFRIDRARFELEYCGRPVALAPKSVELLSLLVDRAGEIVSKRELLESLWPERFVEESNLSQHVYVIRRVLREYGPAYDRAIVTLPKRGYRFVATPSELPVTPDVAMPEAEPALAAMPSTTRSSGAVRPRIRVGWAAALLCVLLVSLMPTAGATRSGLGPRGSEALRLGRYYLDLRTATSIAQAREYFSRVVRSDPESPSGYAGLADVLSLTADYHLGRLPRATYLTQARTLAHSALALDPDSAEGYASLGVASDMLGYRRYGEFALRRAIALDPTYAPAHLWLGTLLFERGDPASMGELLSASKLNPVSTAAAAWLEAAYFVARRYRTAIDYGRRVAELDPRRYDALRELGSAYEAAGERSEALATFRRIPRGSDVFGSVAYLTARVYARSGKRALARSIVQRERRRGNRDSELPFALLALDEPHEAARVAGSLHFESCGERRLFAADPRFDPMRGEAAFRRAFDAPCAGFGSLGRHVVALEPGARALRGPG